MNSIRRKLAFTLTVIVLICTLIMPGLAPPALAASSYPLQPTDTEIVNALDYLRDAQEDDGNIGGFGTSAWAVMAIAAAEEDPHTWKTATGNPSIVDYLRDNSGLIDTGKATDWERSILAIVAAGENPYDFGEMDYVSELENLYDDTQIGYDDTLNDDFWGIIALIAAGKDPDSDIIQNTADFIKTNQGFDGGWSWSVGEYSNTDDTGAAVMALIAAGESPESDAITMGLSFLMFCQNFDGGFPQMYPGESNAASDSWVIDAIVATGEDPTSEDWTLDDNPVNCLLNLQDTDGGFKWKEDSVSNKKWMTSYAIPALLGKPYPVAVYEAPPPTEPTIAFSPSSFNFSATEGGANPADKTLEIWNSGIGTLNWTVSDNAGWLSLSPTGGSSTGEEDEVTVSVDTSSMDAGDYDATITIEDTEATNTPQTVLVSLRIGEPGTEPTISFSPSSLSFTAVEGGVNPSDKTLKIWNSGTGTLDWSVGDDAGWLSLSPTSGSSTGEEDEVTASVDTSSVDAGDYDATITIEDTEATNTPQTVLVSLRIGEPGTEPTISFSPSSLSFTAVEGGVNPSDKTLKIWNSGTGTLDWSVGDDAGWLSLSPTSGSSTGEKDEITVSVDTSSMDAGDYDAIITIGALGATNSPKTMSVGLHIGTGSSYYSLTTAANPTNGGGLSEDVTQPTGGYLEGSEVKLTANPTAGYAFSCWTGDISGNTNPVTITMDSDKNLTANFVLFDTGNLPNIELKRAGLEVTAISVGNYPVKNLTNVPSNLDPRLAYIVDSKGSGSFILSFANVPNASSVKVYKVIGSSWTKLEDIIITGNTVELTMDVGDPIIVFVLSTSSTTDKQSFLGILDTEGKLAIVVIIALIIAIVFVFRRARKVA